jgi:hypothetical protein
MSALALSTREAHLLEGLSGVVLVGIGLELRPHQRLDFLAREGTTLAERHFTTLSLGRDSSAYIYYSKK